ncbi:MAG: YicC family protein [Deltaproteobacteria bacterium]|nr:YicC family protein [Deltaproteobacteria bacterium]
MIRSMTGFGRAEERQKDWRCTVELRSVNHRHLDARIRLPNGLTHLEEDLKKIIRERCERGKIDGTLTLTPDGEGASLLEVNEPLLRGFGGLVRQASEVLGQPVNVSLGDLLQVRDLIRFDTLETGQDTLKPLLETTLRRAVEDLLRMRETEGRGLHADLELHSATLRGLLDEIEPLTQDLPQRQALRLRENLARLLGGETINQDRIAQEIALLAERCDVAEELARFRTHLDHLARLLVEEGPVGRKIEFLLQELNREVNTLGVKSNDTGVSARVIEIKATLERLREQIQNIE